MGKKLSGFPGEVLVKLKIEMLMASNLKPNFDLAKDYQHNSVSVREILWGLALGLQLAWSIELAMQRE